MADTTEPVGVEEKAATTASEFWALLSPEKPLFRPPCELLYRGQADASWGLEPSIVRHPEKLLGVTGQDGMVASEMQVFKEWVYLKSFVDHCDSIGLKIPNDSPDFRDLYLNQNAPAGPGRAFIQTELWPDPKLYELLALAQHHGLPTRLLDWSLRSYVAAYFAISGALQIHQVRMDESKRLAVWVLDVTRKTLIPKLEVIRVPGSNSANVAAQAGVFTLLRQEGGRGAPFIGEIALDKYLAGVTYLSPRPIMKITLPVSEAKAALALCGLYGVTGATLFPDFYGAARGAQDIMRTAWRLSEPDDQASENNDASRPGP